MKKTKSQKLKKAIDQVMAQFDYAEYQYQQVEKFKKDLDRKTLKDLQWSMFQDWLVKNGVVEVLNFEEWLKERES